VDPVRNPFQPGAGRRPPELAGRDAQLATFEVLIQRCETGVGDRGLVLHGLRGVGKTVLLNEFQALAERRDWITVKVEAAGGGSVLPMLVQSLHRSLRASAARFSTERVLGALRVFRSFSVKVDPTGSYSFGVDVQPLPGNADSGDPTRDLGDLLRQLGETSRTLGVGTLVLIDEMQDVPPAELKALNAAAHDIGQGAAPFPVVVCGAGLPSLPEVLSRATSYAERLYEFVAIGPLEAAAAADAIVVPSAALDVTWRAPALAAVQSFSAGYPYFLQTAGKYVWDYAATSPIDLADAQAGLVAARREIDSGLYRARWQRATPAQRQMMRAMSDLTDDEPVSTAAVAQGVGRPRQELSVPRDQLIKKGLVYAPERGLIAFTVPGMADYVRRQPE
jgi:hypothetical protein